MSVDDRVRAELPPGSSPARPDRLFRTLEAVTPGRQTDLPAQLHALAERAVRLHGSGGRSGGALSG